MFLNHLHAITLAAWLNGRQQIVQAAAELPPFVLLLPQGVEVAAETARPLEGRSVARIARSHDPPLSDVTGITLTEPPGTGLGMDGPLNKTSPAP